MRRFLVFAGDTYYPEGGWHDFYDDCDTLLEAQEIVGAATKGVAPYDWFHIVDRDTGEIVA